MAFGNAFSEVARQVAALWAPPVADLYRNPMQAACDLATQRANGEPVLYSTLCETASELGIAPADQTNLCGTTISSITFDQAGVDACGGNIDITGLTAQQVICDPYQTYANLITGDAAVTSIGELVCVGNPDRARSEMPPLTNVSIGQVTCISQDGAAPHNIALSFENCAIGSINAQGSSHMQLSATNCFIENACFEGSKALALDVNGGTLGGNFNAISIAPISTGICNAQFNGTMQYAAGYTSLAGTMVANSAAFEGTALANFDIAGATIPSQAAAQAMSLTGVDALLKALEQAHHAAKPLSECGVAHVNPDGEAISLAALNATNCHRVAHDAPSLNTSSLA